MHSSHNKTMTGMCLITCLFSPNNDGFIRKPSEEEVNASMYGLKSNNMLWRWPQKSTDMKQSLFHRKRLANSWYSKWSCGRS